MPAMEILQSCLILLTIAHQLSWDFVSSEKIECPEIKFPNGRIRSKSRGRLVTFKCRKNLERVGPKFAVCLETGQWSQETPKCVGTTCPKLPPVPNLIVQELFRGGVLKFTCGARMIRSGPETIMCDGTKWSEQPPKCIAGTSLECDFEDNLLCRWSQDGDDDFDWTWHKDETPTALTGPRFDHTLNSSEGHYIYMESSAPSEPGQKTRILSPSYAPDDMTDMCLEFYYHMFGPDAPQVFGALDVYLKPQSVKTTMLSEQHRIFHQAGNQGDHWQRADVKIPAMTEVFQIVFQGTRLGSFFADIAIDDIRLHGCTDETPTGGESTENEGDGKDIDDNVDENADSSVQKKATKKPVTTAKVTDQTTALPLKTSIKSFISSTVTPTTSSSTSKMKETTNTPTTVLPTKSTTEKQKTTFVSTAAATSTTTAKTTTTPTTTTTTTTTTTPIITTRISTAIKSTTATMPKPAKTTQVTTAKTTQITTAKTTQITTAKTTQVTTAKTTQVTTAKPIEVTTAKTTELPKPTLSKSTLAITKTATKLPATTPTSVIPTTEITTKLSTTTSTSVIPTTKTTTKSPTIPTSTITTSKTTTKLPATTLTSVTSTTPKAPTAFSTTLPPTASPTVATSPVTTTTNQLSDITQSPIVYDRSTDIAEVSTVNDNDIDYTTTFHSIVTNISNENDREKIDNNGDDNSDYDNHTKTNRDGDDDSRATDEDDHDNSDEDKTMTTSSDVVDYDSSDVDSEDSLSSNSSALNRSQLHVTDHKPKANQIQEDTTSASNTISDNVNRADDLKHGAVKTQDQKSSSNTNEMLPLIVGVSSAVLVAAVVIAVLAYIWARNQRRKNEKEEEDQMNIITEYVETNLSI